MCAGKIRKGIRIKNETSIADTVAIVFGSGQTFVAKKGRGFRSVLNNVRAAWIQAVREKVRAKGIDKVVDEWLDAKRVRGGTSS